MAPKKAMKAAAMKVVKAKAKAVAGKDYMVKSVRGKKVRTHETLQIQKMLILFQDLSEPMDFRSVIEHVRI